MSSSDRGPRRAPDTYERFIPIALVVLVVAVLVLLAVVLVVLLRPLT